MRCCCFSQSLEESSCQLPAKGLVRLILTSSEPEAGTQWTDDGRLKERRAHNKVRPVPIPPELVAILRAHIDEYGVAETGAFSGRIGAGHSRPPSTCASGTAPERRR